MTTDLTGAMGGGGNYKKTQLIVGYGSHRGYFTGLGEKVEEVSNFPCKGCKGRGQRDDGTCFQCNGTGRKTTTKVPLQYQLQEGLQEEWVTFILSGPGKTKDGGPKSPSTLWVRLKALSGLSDPKEINDWYVGLPKPIRIPIEIMVTDRDDGEGVCIASLRRYDTTAAQQRKPVTVPEEDESWPDEPPFLT